MSETIPHPRETFDLIGGARAERDFLSALSRGRLHHAWLLIGPEGGGKASFAYRAARRLLGARAAGGADDLASDPADPTCRQILARAHPDLLVLQRDAEDGKTRKGIPVDEARLLPEFFALTPAISPYRVAIIDSADDLNDSAANAILKVLEEPPARGVVFLISQSPGALLPTIRSRCRRLVFDPPAPDAARDFVMNKAGVDEARAARLLAMSGGAPGRAWRLAEAGALELDDLATEMLRRLPANDPAATLALADSFRGPGGQERFDLFFERLADHLSVRAADAHSARLAEAWSTITALARRVDAVNLDRGDALLSALSVLKSAA